MHLTNWSHWDCFTIEKLKRGNAAGRLEDSQHRFIKKEQNRKRERKKERLKTKSLNIFSIPIRCDI